jgi:Zn-dependent metalloprotease
MKRKLLLASIALLTACGNSGEATPPDPSGPVITQEQPTAVPDSATDVTALAMARTNGALISLGSTETLQQSAAVADDLGQQHTRFERTYEGMAVRGGDFVVHAKGSTFMGFSATLAKPISVELKPSISVNSAVAAALPHYKGQAALAKVSLVVHAYDGNPVLAYDVMLIGERSDGTPSEQHTYVDAKSGTFLTADETVVTTAATGTGKSLYLGTTPLTSNSITGGFELRDPNRGSTYTVNLNKKTNGGSIFTDADNTWGSGTVADAASAAVDAHVGVSLTWDYYKNVHGRSGIANDGKGSYNRVHYGRNYNNAFWSDSCFCMTYGDGDGTQFLPLTSLDVAAHEMTHGVTARSAKLVYSGESGGLNEATSDIMGTSVEFYANNVADAPDWLIGEKITLFGPRYLRSMSNPRIDGYSIDHYSQYTSSLDVHYSSGLGNHFYYLLANGGTNKTSGQSVTGIGISKAEKIWFRALTVYFTSATNFAGARTGTLSAAADLYGAGGTEYNTVAAAWTACGVN